MNSSTLIPSFQGQHLLALPQRFLLDQLHDLYQMYVRQQLMLQFHNHSLPFFQMLFLHHVHLQVGLDFHLDLEGLHKLAPFELRQEAYLTTLYRHCFRIYYFQAILFLIPNGYLLQEPIYQDALR